jgi:hypothetical protein
MRHSMNFTTHLAFCWNHLLHDPPHYIYASSEFCSIAPKSRLQLIMRSYMVNPLPIITSVHYST